MAAAETVRAIPWWREPTKDQWYAFGAAWLGWTLDAFDFTIFLLIMVPIAEEFKVPLTDVAIVFTLTLWMRLVGATASGWMADRMGRKGPLMISILGYSLCNFIAGFSPAFWFLLLFRALLGFFMGAEWPAGASLAMETWPMRSRGFMSGVLQGSWGLGFLLSSLVYGLFYNHIGWRGMLWVGIAPALALVYIRYFVKEPAVWVENRRRQRAEQREVKVPLLKIFKPGMLGNTLTTCWFQAAGFVTYYSINALFATHLQKDLGLSPALIATPIAFANILVFLAQLRLGLGLGPPRPALGDADPGVLRDPACSDLSVLRQFHLGGNRLRRARVVRGRRHVWTGPELLDRAVPHRNPRHCDRLLLSRRRHPRRDGAADPDLFRDYLEFGVRDPDAHRHPVRADQFHPVGWVRPGDKRHRDGARSRRRLKDAAQRLSRKTHCGIQLILYDVSQLTQTWH